MIYKVLKSEEWANLRSYVSPSLGLFHKSLGVTHEQSFVEICDINSARGRQFPFSLLCNGSYARETMQKETD